AILSANIQDTSFAVLAVSAYAFADTPQPVSVAPVPYESLLYMVLILVIALPPIFRKVLCVIKGSGFTGWIYQQST
ncbi:hypothetical protein OGY67_12500, partial [Citrobacter sp. Cpo015]